MNILVLAHENKQTNERTGEEAIGPELPPAFYRRLNEACSDMFRLSVLMSDEYIEKQDKDGKINVFTRPEGTRVLTLKPTTEVIAKYHVNFEKAKTMPKEIINPTLPKIHRILGKTPSFMCIYGPPGTGKTTLSLSQFLGETK
jgi:ATP-dependent Lon protease